MLIFLIEKFCLSFLAAIKLFYLVMKPFKMLNKNSIPKLCLRMFFTCLKILNKNVSLYFIKALPQKINKQLLDESAGLNRIFTKWGKLIFYLDLLSKKQN